MFKTTAPDGRTNLAGIHIKAYREAKNLSSREMAEKLQLGGLDWDHKQVLLAESGKRSISDIELKIISDVLKISVKKLTEYTTEQDD